MKTSNKEKMNKYLKSLKDSSIASDDWYSDVDNICDAILTISDAAYENLEELKKKYKSDEFKISKTIEMTFQINTLVRIIKEKLDWDEFVLLQDLVHFYQESEEILHTETEISIDIQLN